MQKQINSIAILLLAVCLTLCMAACGSSKSLVSGKTYVFESYSEDGTDATESMTAMYQEQSLAFQADGTCVQAITWSDAFAKQMGISGPVEQSGTYAESGSTVTVTIPSDEGDVVMAFAADGDTLTMTEDGCVTVYRAAANS